MWLGGGGGPRCIFYGDSSVILSRIYSSSVQLELVLCVTVKHLPVLNCGVVCALRSFVIIEPIP